MNVFSWIGYYTDENLLNNILRYKKLDVKYEKCADSNELLDKIGPLEVLFLENVKSRTGGVANGSIIIAPLFLKSIAFLPKKDVVKIILDAVNVAINRKARVICLAGAMGDFAQDIRERVKNKSIIVTGKKFLTATIIDNILHTTKARGIDLSKEKVAIYDANSKVGRICALILSKMCGEIYIYDKDMRSLKDFEEFAATSVKNIKITGSLKDLLKNSKVVISTVFCLSDDIIKEIGMDSMLFDAIFPFWTVKTVQEKRKDIICVPTAWTSRGALPDNELDLFFPKGKIPCCTAEAAMLGLEEQIDSSILEVNETNVVKMRKIGKEHGFSFDNLKSGSNDAK